MFDIRKLKWDKDVCELFDIPVKCLAEVTDSDGNYGETDFDGFLDSPIPIRAVLGDSHGALFGQGCLHKGMLKTTYGTGSSIMMNIGKEPVFSNSVVTSLAWKINGEVNYVLEGNINYTGAVITWMKDDMGLIAYAAGLAVGIYDRESVFSQIKRRNFEPAMNKEARNKKYTGWKNAVGKTF